MAAALLKSKLVEKLIALVLLVRFDVVVAAPRRAFLSLIRIAAMSSCESARFRGADSPITLSRLAHEKALSGCGDCDGRNDEAELIPYCVHSTS